MHKVPHWLQRRGGEEMRYPEGEGWEWKLWHYHLWCYLLSMEPLCVSHIHWWLTLPPSLPSSPSLMMDFISLGSFTGVGKTCLMLMYAQQMFSPTFITTVVSRQHSGKGDTLCPTNFHLVSSDQQQFNDSIQSYLYYYYCLCAHRANIYLLLYRELTTSINLLI